MTTTKTFKRYNVVTGAVDGTMAYDFANPDLYTQGEVYGESRRVSLPRIREWTKENTKTSAAVRTRTGIYPMTFIGTVLVVVLLALVLLAQIQMMTISSATVELENQIALLETQRDKLAEEYETVFNLKDVEEYALGVLGMQEPVDSQIQYLTGVSAADRAVIIRQENADMFSRGLQDILSSVKAYFIR